MNYSALKHYMTEYRLGNMTRNEMVFAFYLWQAGGAPISCERFCI